MMAPRAKAQPQAMQTSDYQELAEVEDSMWYFHALNQRMLLPLAQLAKPGATILDAGCGTGGLIKALQQYEPCWKITGLDYSPVACAFARERTTVPIEQGSIEALPFADKQFDAVVSADVICQIDDGSRALREFARVLKPGGILVINVAAYEWMRSYHDAQMDTRHRFRRSELASLLKQTGFDVTISSYANLLIFPLIIARRKIFVPANPSSDVKPYPPLIEAFCGSMAALEYGALRRGISLPAGNSVFIAARRLG
jgi:ubiquinone/menaquinone biosynthesis C-methylase UbiE